MPPATSALVRRCGEGIQQQRRGEVQQQLYQAEQGAKKPTAVMGIENTGGAANVGVQKLTNGVVPAGRTYKLVQCKNDVAAEAEIGIGL